MERDFKTLAIAIKREQVREKDLLLTLLTPDNGIIYALSYGSLKSNKAIKVPLYSEGSFSLFKKSASSFYIKDAEIISEHEESKNSIVKIGWTSLFSELIIKGKGSDSLIYRLFTSVLDRINDENIDNCAIYFIVHYLSWMGLGGDWENCPECGKRFGEEEILGYSALVNAPCCSSCDTLSSSLILPPNARRYLKRISEVDIDEALSFSISSLQSHRITRYLTRLLQFSFPLQLKTIESGLIV